ncbi:hypothetical protein LC653_11665 [Nostoc sp. CHAB 5784]|uniref:hypothetical protein n=1 Tax=Nostoc mirabile TaxID=2907820 RepID=UPI001E549BE8|nr:hypothetical protein [Nostoc mirabile]MCC5664556.1 hypothetical protein [Nostoc mirabile CHAB5784]
MESTLFTTLTVTEEASLSGGRYGRKPKPATTTPATTTPATTTPTPALLPTPLVNLNTILQFNIVVLSKDIIASNTAVVK